MRWTHNQLLSVAKQACRLLGSLHCRIRCHLKNGTVPFVRLAGCSHVAMLEGCIHALTCNPALFDQLYSRVALL